MCSYDASRTSTSRPLAELEQEICELAAHLAAATCRWLLMIAEFDARNGWWGGGFKSCAHWLSWRCSLGLQTARQHVRVATALRDLPLVREAFARGELSYCKVRAITRVATPETEERLVELARYSSGAQLENIVKGFRGALSANLENANLSHDTRHLSWSWEEDGSLRFHGRLPAEDGALLIAAIEAGQRQLGSREKPTETYEADPAGARNIDGLVEVARTALGGSSSAGSGCEVVVHVDADTLRADAIKDCSQLDEGPALAPETARLLSCDAAIVPMLERDGRPLSVGRRTRTIPRALRRALRRRDHGCRFPGCTHRQFLHAHHIRHWAHGGPTAIDNLVQLCSYHHRLVHEGGFAVECVDGRALRFRRPDGGVIPAPGCGPARGPSIEQRNLARGVVVDDHTCMGKQAGARFDYGITIDGLIARALRGP